MTRLEQIYYETVKNNVRDIRKSMEELVVIEHERNEILKQLAGNNTDANQILPHDQ